jgi:hypothetical protein
MFQREVQVVDDRQQRAHDPAPLVGALRHRVAG